MKCASRETPVMFAGGRAPAKMPLITEGLRIMNSTSRLEDLSTLGFNEVSGNDANQIEGGIALNFSEFILFARKGVETLSVAEVLTKARLS